jgi:hypothetical protein
LLARCADAGNVGTGNDAGNIDAGNIYTGGAVRIQRSAVRAG